MSSSAEAVSPRPGWRKWSAWFVALLWALMVVGVLVRVVREPTKSTVFPTYLVAGERWLRAEPLYPTLRGFIYSPLIAALIAPFTFLPKVPGSVVWRLLNLAAYLGATAAWLRRGVSHVPENLWPWVFLAMLPLSIGNLNNGQLNPAMIAAIMAALLAARAERWMLAAFAIGLVTYLKVYPLAAGLLLAVLYPRKLGWRLPLALLVLGLVSLVLQNPRYVLEQYQAWFATRTADQRHVDPADAPRDLWMLLHACGLDLDLRVYLVVQMLGGAAIAAFLFVGQRRGWNGDRLLTALLALVCCWMLLLGPAPESATYIILAPILSCGLVKAFAGRHPVWMRCLAATPLLLLLSIQLITIYGSPRDPLHMSISPLAALIFCAFAVAWVCRSSLWVAPAEPDNLKI
ncbi:MAG TPA: glycosyltransferase family 87 protein [Chthoniobacteraceae bacterium]|nr:glycosyltransferase family 87 protein [Chthoniobacteraceae bacterium]